MTTSTVPRSETSQPRAAILRSLVVLSLAALFIFIVFDRVASALNSGRGEAGVVVAIVIVLTTILVERVVYKTPVRDAPRVLGLGIPNWRAVLVAGIIGILIVAVLPLFSRVTGAPMTVVDGWFLLAIGLFAQHGIAEELLFRGFVFGHLRAGRTFWRAVWLSMIPFVAAHVLLFFTLPLPIAIMSLLLAVVSSIPLAYLYERGSRTIWAPAIVHTAIEAIKLVTFPEAYFMTAALTFIAASGIIPFLAFAVPQKFYADTSATTP
jgi:membrane protease YdiL (CAAX protease family)